MISVGATDVFSTFVMRLKLDDAASYRSNIAPFLQQFVQILIDPIKAAEIVSDIKNIQALQEFQLGFHYLDLAIKAIEKLDINGFLEYTKLAIKAIGAAA